MKELKVRSHFDSAHYLNKYVGACAEMHGHTWNVIVTFRIQTVEENGIAVDFKKVKELLKKVLPDHKLLNEVVSDNPTAENLVEYIYKKIEFHYQADDGFKNITLHSVELFETPECSITYSKNHPFQEA